MFHYYYIRNEYDNNSRLFFTGTDSLIYEIKTKDIHENFSKDKELFDFSNCSAESKNYDNSNKLFFDKIKNETVGFATKEFVGLKLKM